MTAEKSMAARRGRRRRRRPWARESWCGLLAVSGWRPEMRSVRRAYISGVEKTRSARAAALAGGAADRELRVERINRAGWWRRRREGAVDVEQVAEDLAALLADLDLRGGQPAAEEGGDQGRVGGEVGGVGGAGGGLVEDGHDEEVGGGRGGVEGLDEVVRGGEVEDLGEGDGAEELDGQACEDGGVLGVLLEDGG